MFESLTTLKCILRPTVVRGAVAFSLIASVLMFFLDSGLPYAVAASLSVFSAFWSAIAITTTIRFHLFRQGSSLVPGLRNRTLPTSLAFGLALLALPVACAAMAGYSVTTMAALSSCSFALSWALGPLFPDNQRVALSLLSFALGVDAVLFFEHSRGQREFWIGGVDPLWQKAALVALALSMLVWSTRHYLRMREDSWVLHRWWDRGRGDCMDCSGQAGLPGWAISAMPAFARRRVPHRDNGHTIEPQLRRALFSYSLNPLSPIGLSLIYLPFVILVTWMAISDHKSTNLFWNPNLFLLNGLIIMFGGLNPRRFRREWLRPASRVEIVEGVVGALGRNVAIFTVAFLSMSLLVHAVSSLSIVTTRVYWLGFLMAPFLMALGYGVALWASRWTRWSGLVGFFPAWVLAALAFSMYDADPTTPTLAIWAAVSVGLAAVGWILARVGVRHWQNAEIG